MSDTSRKWYLWPQGYVDGFVPWFVALRRVVFWPILLTGMAVIFVAILGGFGLSEAKRNWRETR
jgi:hypothetical protein